MPSSARTRVGPRWKNFATPRQLVTAPSVDLPERVGGTERPRGARPRCPRSAHRGARARTRARARRRRAARRARPCSSRCARGRRRGRAGCLPPGRRARGQRRAERVDRERGEHTEHDPERRRRATPVASDSPATWRTTIRCVQPSAFSVPSSRTRLPTDESVSSAASRNAAAAATIESTKPRLCERFDGVDERAADLVGDLLRARDLRLRQRRLDLLLHLRDRRAVRGADEHDVREALSASQASAAASAAGRRRRSDRRAAG